MLWKLGIPNGLAWMFWTVATFADAFFIGFLGTEALAVLALVFPFQMLMLMMAGGAIGGGTTSSIGRAIGKKDFKKAEKSYFHSILICFLMYLIYGIIFYFYSYQIFSFMGAEGDVLKFSILFSKLFFSFSLFIWLFNILSSIIRGLGNTYIPSKALMIGSVAQIFLSYILIFGMGPIPNFKILGVAISIIICHIGMSIYLLYYLVFKQKVLRLKFQYLKLEIFNDIMNVGGLGLLNSITIALTVAIVTGYVGNFGPEALAGYGIGSRLELMLTPIIFGLGAALTASVSINIGSGQFNRAKKIAWTGGLISFILIGIIGFFVSTFPSLWINNFSVDLITIDFAERYLKSVGPFYCLFGLGQALYFASQGTGKMIKPIIVGISRFTSVLFVGYFSLFYGLSVDYIFYGVSLGFIITGAGMSWCLFGKDWKK